MLIIIRRRIFRYMYKNGRYCFGVDIVKTKCRKMWLRSVHFRVASCFFHPVRLKSKHVSRGLSLFAFLVILGCIQYVHVQEAQLIRAHDRIARHEHLYREVCENHTSTTTVVNEHSRNLCPCLPRRTWLVTEDALDVKEVDYSSLGTDMSQIAAGSWKPRHCVARQRIAVVIPARNRDEHLQTLTQHLHPFLQSQHLEYSVYVVDQVSPSIFNKAANMNAAYLELRKRVSKFDRPFDCIIFQDVDQLPMDNRNMYTCFYSPLHLGGYRGVQASERGVYINSFGGITSLSIRDFEAVNGYSNAFWGWGGEDSNFAWRISKLNKGTAVYPAEIAQTYRLEHKADSGNPVNYNRVWDAESYFSDGITTLKYRLAKSESHPLYTKFYIDLEPLVDEHRCKTSNTTESNDVVLSCLTNENIETGKIYCCHNSSRRAYCCSKPLYFQWMFILYVSIRRYPGTWACCILLVLIPLAIIYVHSCRRKKPRLPKNV